MKFMITKTMESKVETETGVDVKVEVEVELPYYFNSEWVGFGKVEEHRCTIIQINHIRDCDQYELRINHRPAAYYSSYMADKYKSSKEEFQKAAGKMLESFTDATGEQK